MLWKISAFAALGINPEDFKKLSANVSIQNTIDTKEDYYSYIGRDRLVETVGNNIQNTQSRHSFWVGSTSTTNVRSTYTLSAGGVVSLSSSAALNLIAPKIYLGTESSTSEPMVLGETLKQLLKAFIQAHLSNASSHVITSMGPGTLNPGLVAELKRIQSQLDRNTILSDDNFVTKKNSTPRTVPSRTPLH